MAGKITLFSLFFLGKELRKWLAAAAAAALRRHESVCFLVA